MPGLVKSVSTIPGISDHDIIVLDADLKAERTKKAPHKVYKWDKANWEQLKQCTKVFVTKYLTAVSEFKLRAETLRGRSQLSTFMY